MNQESDIVLMDDGQFYDFMKGIEDEVLSEIKAEEKEAKKGGAKK